MRALSNISRVLLEGEAPSVQLFRLASLIFAFCLPLLTRGIMLPIGLWLLTWFFVPKRSLKEVWLPVLIFSGLYLFHLFGMSYTDDVGRGLKDLEQKFSILAFPLLLGAVKPQALPGRRMVFMAFIAGTALALILGFVAAAIRFPDTGLIEEFYTTRFSNIHHPSYLAFYINFCIAFLLYWIFRQGPGNKKKTVLAWILVYVLALCLVFPASKMGFIHFYVLVLLAVIAAAKWRVLRSRNTALLAALPVAFLLFLQINTVASARIQAAVNVVGTDNARQAPDELETNTARLHAWRLSIQEINRRPLLGTGTGDSHDVMIAAYKNEGLHALADLGLNPHNNYLQIALALGTPALLWFLVSLLFPMKRIFRHQDWLYLFLILSMALHCLVESVLEKQSGVVFFTFFNAYLYFSAPTHFCESGKKHSELEMR